MILSNWLTPWKDNEMNGHFILVLLCIISISMLTNLFFFSKLQHLCQFHLTSPKYPMGIKKKKKIEKPFPPNCASTPLLGLGPYSPKTFSPWVIACSQYVSDTPTTTTTTTTLESMAAHHTSGVTLKTQTNTWITQMTDKDDPARLASKSGTTSNLSLRFIFPHYASHPIVDCIYLGQGFLCPTRGQMTWNVIFLANYNAVIMSVFFLTSWAQV